MLENRTAVIIESHYICSMVFFSEITQLHLQGLFKGLAATYCERRSDAKCMKRNVNHLSLDEFSLRGTIHNLSVQKQILDQQ